MSAEQEGAIEKVLKALGDVQAPEGLEARIAQGLEQRAAAGRRVESRWREMFARSAMAGAWWRGALVGAAVSMLAVGAVLMGLHGVRRPAERLQTSEVMGNSAAASPKQVAAAIEARRPPCPSLETAAVAHGAGVWRGSMLRVESVAPSQPFAPMPLTSQERALVRLVQSGDAKELAMLNPEVREKQAAEEAAQFRSFFAQPAKTVAAAPAETIVGGPGLATREDEPSVAETDAAESSTKPVSGENR